MAIGDLIALGKLGMDLVKKVKNHKTAREISELIVRYHSLISEANDANGRLREENTKLRKQIDDDRDKEKVRDSLKLHDNAYLKEIAGQDVAHCIACFETRGILVPLVDPGNSRTCPVCKECY